MTDTAAIYANDPAMRAVSLGLDTQHFITQSKVGVYVVDRAHQCRVDALEQLAQVDVTDTLRIRTLQWEARIPDMVLQWLDEAIAMGTSAEEAIRAEEGA